ncbi:MAG: hypothetical protein RLZZ458_2372 [Planctomycetota bacterium]
MNRPVIFQNRMATSNAESRGSVKTAGNRRAALAIWEVYVVFSG